jgi:transposase
MDGRSSARPRLTLTGWVAVPRFLQAHIGELMAGKTQDDLLFTSPRGPMSCDTRPRAWPLNRPGIDGGFQPPKDGSHGGTEEVPGRAAGAGDPLRARSGRRGEKLSVNAACRRVGEQLGIVPDSLRNWVQQARIDAGNAPGLTTDERARLVELERENRELRRANEILKSASAFFAAELDRPYRR